METAFSVGKELNFKSFYKVAPIMKYCLHNLKISNWGDVSPPHSDGRTDGQESKPGTKIVFLCNVILFIPSAILRLTRSCVDVYSAL